MLNRVFVFLGDFWTLARPYWSSEERWAARGLLAAVIGLALALVALNLLLNDWNNHFYNALQDGDVDAFTHQILRFCVLAVASIVVAVHQVYLGQMLQIRWRRWLTRRYLDEWLTDQTYYRLQFAGTQTDNPDQRIAEDLRLFVQLTLTLTVGLVGAVATLVSFLGILWMLSGSVTVPFGGATLTIPGFMVWVALLYAVAGSALTHLIGRPLSRLNFDQQRREADFRFALVRLRENAESVALHAGEGDEARALGGRFATIAANWWAIMRCQKRLGWFTSGYAQVAVIFPVVVAAPRFFAGALPLGGLMQTASAFGHVQGALSWFVEAYVMLAEWRATVDRLTGFRASVQAVQAIDALSPQIARGDGDGRGLDLDHLSLSLPNDSEPLLQANLRLDPGVPVLVSGPSGSGKSTLFRAIAGIWPFGQGAIRLPAGARLMFLPQRPYLPVATLRAAVSYPAPAEGFPEHAVRDALSACGLGRLADRLNECDHWTQRLSPGEQQRIAFARARLHEPDWLFLDEATSALDLDAEAELYGMLRRDLPLITVVSIGHRASLAAFHSRHLTVTREADGVGRLGPA